MSTPDQSHYRRPLPKNCIDFTSVQGQKLFISALQKGFADAYLRLVGAITAKGGPEHCGVSSYEAVLNAWQFRPANKEWDAPWKWDKNTLYDCCTPLTNAKWTGMPMEQFNQMSRFTAQITYADDSEDFLKTLRKTVIESVGSKTKMLVAHYDRSVLEQTGRGHFSPIAAYEPASDRVLINDVAYYIYPPHWIKLDDLAKAMSKINETTGKNGGFVMLELKKETGPMRVIKSDSAD